MDADVRYRTVIEGTVQPMPRYLFGPLGCVHMNVKPPGEPDDNTLMDMLAYQRPGTRVRVTVEVLWDDDTPERSSGAMSDG